MKNYIQSQKLENITQDEIESLMKCRENIRHVSVIGGTSYRKSSVASLLAQHATTAQSKASSQDAGEKQNEQERISIVPIMVSLCVTIDKSTYPETLGNNKFLVNMLDPPNCPDFPGAANLTLSVTDGALVMLDCNSKISSQTEALLTTALNQRNKFTLMLDNIESSILALQTPEEELYQMILASVNGINGFIDDSTLPGEQENLSVTKGSIAFSSVSHGWAFTIPQLAVRYCEKFNMEAEALAEKLWGDNYFDSETKTWHTSSSANGKTLERSFNQFILAPIYAIYDAVLKNSQPLDEVRAELDIQLSREDQTLKHKPLLQSIMHQFLPAPDAILQLVCTHLPSPITAQPHRTDLIFDTHMDESLESGIRTCDPNGPLIIYSPRAIPSTDNRHFYALGRVYSGSVSAGMQLTIQNNESHGTKTKTIDATTVPSHSIALPVPSVCAGNLVAIPAQVAASPPHLLSSKSIERKIPFRAPRLTTGMLLYFTVDVQNPEDLPKLGFAFRLLSGHNPWVQPLVLEDGQHAIYGYDETQLRDCLKHFEEELLCLPIKVAGPFTSYRETIRTQSEPICQTRSPNKRITFQARAIPISDELVSDIERFAPRGNCRRYRTRFDFGDHLVRNYGWGEEESRKIWAFGDPGRGSDANMLVNVSKGVQYIEEIQDSAVSGFRWAVSEGPLAEEPVRGVRLNILDVTFMHGDGIRRGGGQTIPAVRRVMYGAIMSAEPYLKEPVFRVEIRTPERFMEDVRRVITERGGRVDCEDTIGGYLRGISAFVHASQSFGLPDDVGAASGELASCSMVFSNWDKLKGDLDETITAIRTRKGLSPTAPGLEKYYDA